MDWHGCGWRRRERGRCRAKRRTGGKRTTRSTGGGEDAPIKGGDNDAVDARSQCGLRKYRLDDIRME